MRSSLILASLGVVMFAAVAFGAGFTERIDSIPDITQTDPSCRFPSGGVHYCGPCAISNGLVWLGENGYERFIPPGGNAKYCQIKLTNTLASRKYMDTTLEWGTSPEGVLTGLARYVRDRGYRYRRLCYQGWRKVPQRFDTGVIKPQLEWIKAGLSGDSAVWLNVGWYRYSPKAKEYERVGGHWVTLAGYGVDANGKEDPNVLIIHDPGALGGNGFSNDYARAVKMGGGTLSGGTGESCEASGFYKLTGGMRIHKGVDAAVVDGAILLEMKNPRIVSANRKEPTRPATAKQ